MSRKDDSSVLRVDGKEMKSEKEGYLRMSDEWTKQIRKKREESSKEGLHPVLYSRQGGFLNRHCMKHDLTLGFYSCSDPQCLEC